MDFIPSAVRELEEELGVKACPEELVYCGQRRIRFEESFHGRMFRDNQVSNIYLLWLDRDPYALVPTDDRPLADTADKMKQLYLAREPVYRAAADETVPVEGTPEDIADLILNGK